MEDYGEVYFAFVPEGYVLGATPQAYELVEGKRIFGHVGFVPASVLTWSGEGRRAICITYSEMRRSKDGVPVRGIPGVGNAKLHFRPSLFALFAAVYGSISA
jgi:hypothetical protein